jgi:hypothetical protein
MELMMGETEWELHNEWLRKEELERYRLSVPTPATVPKVTGVLNGEQKPPLLGVSAIVIGKSELLVGSECAPATPQ